MTIFSEFETTDDAINFVKSTHPTRDINYHTSYGAMRDTVVDFFKKNIECETSFKILTMPIFYNKFFITELDAYINVRIYQSYINPYICDDRYYSLLID